MFIPVYKQIKSYIDENRLTQVAVAKAAGIPSSTFNAMLNGRRRIYADEFLQICDALGKMPVEFIN